MIMQSAFPPRYLDGHCAFFRHPLSTFHHKPLWSSCELYLRSDRCEFIMGAPITIKPEKIVLLIAPSGGNDSPRVLSFFLCGLWWGEFLFMRWIKNRKVFRDAIQCVWQPPLA